MELKISKAELEILSEALEFRYMYIGDIWWDDKETPEGTNYVKVAKELKETLKKLDNRI